MNNKRAQRIAFSLLASALLVGTAACGDDDDVSSDDASNEQTTDETTGQSTAQTAAPDPTSEPTEPTAAPDHTGHGTDHSGSDTTQPEQGTADPTAAAFCQAELAAEAAAAMGDPAAAGPAFEALAAAAPAEIADVVDEVIANAEAGPGSPEFDASYGEMIAFVKDNCGFHELALTAGEYVFGGLPEEVAAGPTVITMQNIGDEFHELVLMRINDGVTESVDELLALPEEEAMSKVTPTGFVFAPNATTANTVVDLPVGRYVAVCFLPTGATPEVMAQMDGPESSLPEGAGPPHFTQGMVHEFTVA